MPPIPGSLDANGDFVEPKSLAKSIDEAMPDKPTFGQLQWRQMLIGFATGIIDYFQEFEIDDHQTLTLNDASGSQSLVIKNAAGNDLLRIEVNNGSLLLKASAKVTIEAPSVELIQGASHAAVFGDELVQYLSGLAEAIKTHTHPDQMADPSQVTPGGKYPVTATASSVQPAGPDQQQLLSTKIKEG
jgi:hypothetical protein